MPERTQAPTIPVSREPVSLLAVDRAVAELRQGRMVVVAAARGRAALALAAEAATEATLEALGMRAQSRPVLALTGRRAKVLGLGDKAARPGLPARGANKDLGASSNARGDSPARPDRGASFNARGESVVSPPIGGTARAGKTAIAPKAARKSAGKKTGAVAS